MTQEGIKVRTPLSFKILTLALTLGMLGSSNYAIAAPKKGSVCKKIAQTFGKGSKKVTCTPVTQLKWVSTPVKPLPGSIFAPAKLGQQVRITSADFKVENIDLNVGDSICAENALNEGCEIGLTLVPNASRYGNVIIDEEKNIISFEEKVELENEGLINIGLYRLEKSIFSKITNTQFSLEKVLFPLLIEEKKLKGSILKTKFIDIGIPIDYHEFCKWKK